MAAHDELITVWTAGKPANATGDTFAAGDPAETKIAAINGWTVPKGSADPALISPSAILNAVLPADLQALVTDATAAGQNKLLTFILLLSGATVDASEGTTVRAGIQYLFTGKTTTLQRLGALVAPYDDPEIPWWQSVGFQSPIALGDVIAAGLS